MNKHGVRGLHLLGGYLRGLGRHHHDAQPRLLGIVVEPNQLQ